MKSIIIPPGTAAAIAHGDQEALEWVVRAFTRPLVAFARHFIHDPHLSQDLVQEVFVRLWRSAHTVQGEAGLCNWLFAVTRNRCIDEMRRYAHHVEVPYEIATITNLCSSDAVDSTRQVRDQLEATDIIAHLPAVHRAVVALRGREYTQSQIAERLHIPQGTVKSRLSAAQKCARGLRHQLGYDETA